MAKDLKKFVNIRFLKTVDLALVHELMARHEAQLRDFDLGVLSRNPSDAGQILQSFFAGPEDRYPDGLTADLHLIAELGNKNGLRLLLERAAANNTQLIPKEEVEGGHLNPKHVALRAFLKHREVFDAASDFLAIETRLSLSEYSGPEENVHPEINREVQDRFEREAGRLFQDELSSSYCRIGWYEDDDELNVVVSHGEAVVITQRVKDGREESLTYRPVGHTNLAYDAVEGRLKVGGIGKALRPKLGEVFAATVLDRPGFFAGEGSQDLYTLRPIERMGLRFAMDRSFDQSISRADIIEVEARKLPGEGAREGSPSPWSVVMRDRHNALQRLGHVAPRVSFASGGYELGYIIIAVSIETGGKQPVKRRVKVKPPHTAAFKRHRFEGRIMELLRRNKLCCERKPSASPAAAK
jgi:hypothetical protein